MNARLPSLPSQIPSAVGAEPPVRLGRIMGALVAAVACFDICFWKVRAFGLSVPVFFLALAGIILATREKRGRKWTTLILPVLLAGAAVAAILETGFTNTLVFLILTVAWAGDTYFVGTGSAWGRGLSQVVALIRAPGRIFWMAARLVEANLTGGFGRAGGIVLILILVLPALALVLIFGSLLAAGNAVFGSWTDSFFTWLWKTLVELVDPVRILLWGAIAFLVLPLLRPAQVSAWWWSWTQRLPRWPEIVSARAAFFSSVLVLITLNALFLAANAADALFLWRGEALPSEVTYSAYVHQGVEALISTVILSALVLVSIFQQAPGVTMRPSLRVLALGWVGQNLFLLLSVALRLKLYIEAYDMTVERLGVIIFLGLVAAGYLLLTIKIMREKSLSWLLGGCLLAAFATFYVTQFLDLGGWSADYNVARWQKDPSRDLDVSYLRELGPSAWPALRRARETAPLDASIAQAWEAASLDAALKSEGAGLRSWREFSLRAWLNQGHRQAPH